MKTIKVVAGPSVRNTFSQSMIVRDGRGFLYATNLTTHHHGCPVGDSITNKEAFELSGEFAGIAKVYTQYMQEGAHWNETKSVRKFVSENKGECEFCKPQNVCNLPALPTEEPHIGPNHHEDFAWGIGYTD